MPIRLLCVLLFLATPALAQKTPGWIADSSGCRVWNSAPIADERITWTGTCVNKLAEGKGVLQWFIKGRPADRYEGEYREGRTHGRGVFHWDYDGDVYDGEWYYGEPHGRGVHTRKNGDRYEGEWRSGAPNGQGTFKRGANVYTGTWTNGCFSDGGQRAWFLTTEKDCGFK